MSARNRNKGRKAEPSMYIHHTNAATTYEPSADGRRVKARTSVVDTNSRPADYEEDDPAMEEALGKEDFSYLAGDDAAWVDDNMGWWEPTSGGEAPVDEDGIKMDVSGLSPEEGTAQYERWLAADTPMKVFVGQHREETLDEMLRSEGRGSPEFYEQCAGCQSPAPVFRCAKQACIGPGMYCEPCVVQLHRQLPTHLIEKWSEGGFFVPMMQKDLDTDAPFQLGHVAGTGCGRARPAHKDFVIIDVLGIRVVKLNFCGCGTPVAHRQQLLRAGLWPATSIDPQTCATMNVVRLFEVQNCLGKISAYDFMRSLEMLSNNDGLERHGKGADERGQPDRRRAFRAIVQQYRMMAMIKKAGRGHDDSGVAGTAQGELAEPKCRLCPLPGVNLPEGWDQIEWDKLDEDQRYKYTLELSQDANFKLINRNVSTEERDPIVDDGAGFFCNRAEYAEHIRKNVDEEEISSCSGFQAMFLANAKRVKGLRVTGVAGVTCARHNMWRPNGIGDLQVGERFCNMDFVFFSAVLGFVLTYLVLSYDIACQFSKNIWTRMAKLPSKLHLNIDMENVRWMVPNFHLPPHKIGCHSAFSFHWLWGAGRTHGETVEQNWEFLNGIAASTKLMGLGARHTALEGLFSFHNFRRLVAHRRLLKERMAEGIVDGKAHRDSFEAFNEGMSQVPGVDVGAWRVWVDKWEKERHVENEKGSPYELLEDGMTLKEIRLLLAAEEYLRTGDNEEVEREDTPSTFLIMGMELEELQRQLAVAMKAAGPNPTPTQQLDFLKRRTTVRTRLQAFRKLQGTYMPKLRRYLTTTQKAVWDADNQQPEATRLFMPSEIASEDARKRACAKGLEGVEARLRTGEIGDALKQLRQGLRTRTMTNRFKIRNWTGQRALTRGQGILRQINIRIHSAKLRYRYGRQALMRLKKHGAWEKEWPYLEDDDVRALNDRSLREEEQAHDAFLGALGTADGPAARGAVAAGEGHRKLSWIWYSAGTRVDGDDKIHEALRVEWCKAYSRANRWPEELVLVEEEMRRTIAYGEYEEERWKARAVVRTKMLGKPGIAVDPVVLEGVRAYALEQADRERRTCELLRADWAPLRAKAAAYLRGEDMGQLPAVVVKVDGEEHRWSEGRMQSGEEAENDLYQQRRNY